MAVIGAERERTSVGGHSGQSCEKWRRPKIGENYERQDGRFDNRRSNLTVNSHINPAIILKLKLPHIEPLGVNFADQPSKKYFISHFKVVFNLPKPKAAGSK